MSTATTSPARLAELRRDGRVLRREADSRHLAQPRVLIRVFLAPGGLEDAIGYYERLHGATMDAWIPYPEAGLTLATVGPFLLIEGDEESTRPFRATDGTLLVNDAAAYYEHLVAAGAQVVFPLRRVPTGTNFTVRNPDGSVVEYVQHRPTAHEGGPGPASHG